MEGFTMKRLIVALCAAGFVFYAGCSSSTCQDMDNANQTVLAKVNQCTMVDGGYCFAYSCLGGGPNAPILDPGMVCFDMNGCNNDMSKCSSADQAVLEKQVACANTFNSGSCDNLITNDAGLYDSPSLRSCLAGAGTLSAACANAFASNTLFFYISFAPGPVPDGVAVPFQLTAVDYCGNVTPGYVGTVTFASNDVAAYLPANYTFTAMDQGSHAFMATFNTLSANLAIGSTTVTATDTTTKTITNSTTLNVVCSANSQCPAGMTCNCGACGAPPPPGPDGGMDGG
jgi:hypothetical protein